MLRFCLAIVTAFVALAGLSGLQSAPVDSTSVRAFRPESLLPNFIDHDPSEELALAIGFSPAQLEHAARCYQAYRDAALALGVEVQNRVEQEGHWTEYKAQGAQASAEIRRKAIISLKRATESQRSKYLEAEIRLFEDIALIVAEAQMAAFRSASRALRRRSWCQFEGLAIRQDFFQFADPIAILISERDTLEGEENLRAEFDEFVRQFEEDLDQTLPNRWMAHQDARRATRLARIGQDKSKVRAAIYRESLQWRLLYSSLETGLETGCTYFDHAGKVTAARRAREAFWRVCFPNLIAFETTPALCEAIAEHAAELDAEARKAVQSVVNDYLARRHALLRTAVNEHIRDYVDFKDPAQRADRLTGLYFGSSSTNVATSQLARCQLALKTQQILNEFVGPLDQFLTSDKVQQAKLAATNAGQLEFDTPRTEQELLKIVEEFRDASDRGNDESPTR